MKLSPVRANIHNVLGRSFLLVERYDRVEDVTKGLLRIHQEDFCQALGVVPEVKYQNEGGPDLQNCFDLVRRATRPHAPQTLSTMPFRPRYIRL